MLADIVNGADIWAVQGRGGLSFTLETGKRLGIPSNVVGEELECNKTVKPRVSGLVDHAHAATAQLFNNAVVRDGLADQ